MVEIKELNKKDIPKVIELSLTIFKPKDGRNNSYHDPQEWRDYLDNNGMLLGAFVNKELVGYLLARREDNRQFHLWMSGIKMQFRRRGLMTKLLKGLESCLAKQGHPRLTVNTYEEKFPAMFALLKKEGYKVWKTKRVDWDGKKVLKSFFVKKLKKPN